MSTPQVRFLFFGALFFDFCRILSASEGNMMPDTAPVFLCDGEIFWIFVVIFFIFRFFASKADPEQTGFPRPKSTPGQKRILETIALEEFRREAQNQPDRAFPHPANRPQLPRKSSPRTSSPQTSVSPGSQYSIPDQYLQRTPMAQSRKQPVGTVSAHSGIPSHLSAHSHTEEILAPVYELAGHGKLDLLRKKLAKGANVNEQDPFFYETGLHRAAKRGDAAAVQLLLESGADVRFVTLPYGETPLHFAVSGRNPQVIRLLLQYGANPNAKDCFGRTPAQCSRFYGELREIFEKAGAKVQ